MYFIPQVGQINLPNSSATGLTCWPISDSRIDDRLSSAAGAWCFSAHAWQRWTSSFCFLTSLVRWTVAGFEQNWHFMPEGLRKGAAGNPGGTAPTSASALFE